MRQVLVCGGGASGLMAALAAAEEGAEVTLIEKNREPGKKLSMTGNGRCNLTNLHMDRSCFHSDAPDLVEDCLKRFGPGHLLAFFHNIGLLTVEEGGYVYPRSGQASTVVEVLLQACRFFSVRVCPENQLKEVCLREKGGREGGFFVRTNKAVYEADRVIIGTGGISGPRSTGSTGDSYYILKKLGLSVREAIPALTALLSEDSCLPDRGGVRVRAGVSFFSHREGERILLAREEGEVQLTDHSVSGIPVLQLSGLCGRILAEGGEVSLSLDFFPDYTDRSFEEMIGHRIQRRGACRTLEDFLRGCAGDKISEMVLKKQGLKGGSLLKKFSDRQLERILMSYRQFSLEISSCADAIQAQATAGGLCLEEVGEDMEVFRLPGLFVVGELLDVDGRCGGYNLQWAFTSGYLAGKAAAR